MLQGPRYTVRDDCNVLLQFGDFERRRNFQCFLNTLSCPQPKPSLTETVPVAELSRGPAAGHHSCNTKPLHFPKSHFFAE
jgi:hypothetical protein